MNKKIRKKNRSLQKLSDEAIDAKINTASENAFKKVNCLDCANCCKTKGPQLNKKDIGRIAAHLNLEKQQFVDRYLKFNENDDYVMQQLPCPFLAKDNKCEIYEVAPKACRSYPHTHTSKLRGLLSYLEEHSDTCPIIEEIYKEV